MSTAAPAAQRPQSAKADVALPLIDYEHFDNPESVHRVLAAARRQSPIALGPHGPELLTYELVRVVLRDERFRIPCGFSLAAQGITSGPLWDRVAGSLLSLSGPEHHRLRRLVSKAFAPRAAAHLRDTITDVITELVNPLTRTGCCDVVADIARRYPIPIICTLLGTPRDDWELFSDWTDTIMQTFGWDAAAQAPNILSAWDALDEYLDDMVERRRGRLSDDLLSELIQATDDGDRLTHSELLMLAAGLLLAGTDTTRHQLAASAYALCRRPDQWALLGAHPELARSAVEETVRHSPIAIGTMRAAVEDVELAGVTFTAGRLVGVNTAAANRDPAAFDSPDVLDITRTGAPAMLTFGGGEHYCLGVHLAKLELAEALVTITSRMPRARIVAPAPWQPFAGLTGPTALMIEFEAGH